VLPSPASTRRSSSSSYSRHDRGLCVWVQNLVDVRTDKLVKFTSRTGSVFPLEMGKSFHAAEFIKQRGQGCARGRRHRTPAPCSSVSGSSQRRTGLIARFCPRRRRDRADRHAADRHRRAAAAIKEHSNGALITQPQSVPPSSPRLCGC
jgi:hypothetical protein